MSGEAVLVHAACTVLDFFKQTKRVQQVNYKRPKSGTLTGSHSVFFLLLAVYELVSTKVLSLVSLPAFIHGFPLILYALYICRLLLITFRTVYHPACSISQTLGLCSVLPSAPFKFVLLSSWFPLFSEDIYVMRALPHKHWVCAALPPGSSHVCMLVFLVCTISAFS